MVTLKYWTSTYISQLLYPAKYSNNYTNYFRITSCITLSNHILHISIPVAVGIMCDAQLLPLIFAFKQCDNHNTHNIFEIQTIKLIELTAWWQVGDGSIGGYDKIGSIRSRYQNCWMKLELWMKLNRFIAFCFKNLHILLSLFSMVLGNICPRKRKITINAHLCSKRTCFPFTKWPMLERVNIQTLTLWHSKCLV